MAGRRASLPIKDGSLSSIAVVIVAGGMRGALIDEQILPTVRQFQEILVVGEHHAGTGYRYLYVPAMTHSTNDALVKRDVGTLATNAEWILYLSDDHSVGPDFTVEFHSATWNAGVLIPSRWTQHPTQGRIRIPMGDPDYCGGHGGVFRRWVIQALPWTAMPHHRNWDVLASQHQMNLGARFVVAPQLEIEDQEPEQCPWQ